MRRVGAATVVGVALLAVVVVAGCGGSSGGGAPSPASYRQKANAICAAGNRAAQAIPKPTSKAQVKPYLQKALAAVKPQFAKLQALKVPASLPSAKNAVALGAKQEAVLAQAVKAINGGADPLITIEGRQPMLMRLSNQEDAAWRKAGVKVCAMPSKG